MHSTSIQSLRSSASHEHSRTRTVAEMTFPALTKCANTSRPSRTL